jgi:two-component system repressor protein LuxO
MAKNQTDSDSKAQILMVEDSPTTAEMYAALLETSGYKVDSVDTGKKAIKAVKSTEYDLMLLDLSLPDMDGMEILRKLEEEGSNVPTIVITGNGSVLRAVEAMRLGAMDFLMKPCSLPKLGSAVASAIERRSATRSLPTDATGLEASPTKRGPSGFLGHSPAMKNVFALIESVAQSSASVFITGKSGTGKELCAQAIHDSGPRRNGPFIPLNCAAIPRELMESEVFGHRKGAFTGAHADHEGSASLADGGSLFLDEICEMQLDLQAKLLRFIQTGVYKRVGDGNERTSDIRFICATNRDPLEEVQNGRFREDLYYRLHVVPIHMPALHDRGEDIMLLAERFLADYSTIEGKNFRRFDNATRAAITHYAWPGNVRQLENAIRQAIVLNDAEVVSVDMLPGSVREGVGLQVQEGWNTTTDDTSLSQEQIEDVLIRPLDELDILAIDAALERFNGNVSRAARALDISTSTIYRKKQAWDRRKSDS